MIQRSHLSPLPAQPFIQRHVGRRLIVAMSLLGSLAVYACGTPAEPVVATIDGPVVATIDLPTSLSLWTSPAEAAVSTHVYASPGGRELSLVLYLPQYSEDVLVATVRDGAGRVLVSPRLTWTSSDVSVVTVTVSSSSGHVSATGVGSATITASADGATSNAVTVTVREGGGPLPAIMYVYGGGWVLGDEDDQFYASAIHMSAKGFVGATIEHRLTPEFIFPAHVEDSKAAVRWLRANATTYSIDPDRIGVAGYSSGGNLAMMVGTTSHLAEFEGDGGNPGFSSRVQAVAAFAGNSDFAQQPGRNIIENYLGATFAENPDLWALASPITHVGGGSPPFLLLHGTDDATVPYQMSVNMMNRLMAAGVSAELFTAQGASHADLDPTNLSWGEGTLGRAMEEFFVRILK